MEGVGEYKLYFPFLSWQNVSVSTYFVINCRLKIFNVTM